MTALLGHPVDLVRAELGVPDDGDGERNETARLGAAPAVDVPVVVGLHHGAGLVLVLAPGEELAAELREGWKAHGAEHAVDRHVAHTLVDVVAADPHVVERGGLNAVLLGRAADDCVEADVGDHVAVVLPDVGPVVAADELRGIVLVLLRQQPVEHPTRLNDVVVDTDQDHVLSAHFRPPLLPLDALASALSLTPMSYTLRAGSRGGAKGPSPPRRLGGGSGDAGCRGRRHGLTLVALDESGEGFGRGGQVGSLGEAHHRRVEEVGQGSTMWSKGNAPVYCPTGNDGKGIEPGRAGSLPGPPLHRADRALTPRQRRGRYRARPPEPSGGCRCGGYPWAELSLSSSGQVMNGWVSGAGRGVMGWS